MTRLVLRFLLLMVLLLPNGAGAQALLSVGPDDPSALFPVPRALTALSTSGVASPVITASDDSVGFDGGLALRPGSAATAGFYAIGNGRDGQSTLYRMAPGETAFAPVLALGEGFSGGLAYRDSDHALYLVRNDDRGASTLHRVDLTNSPSSVELVGSLGDGFTGGLTYRAADDLLYAIAADDTPLFPVARRLTSIEVGPPLTVAALFSLGGGSLAFDGGLAADPSADRFYAIANDDRAASTLQTFTLAGGGASSAIGASFGQGFSNAGLIAVPEPASSGKLVAVVVTLTAIHQSRRMKTSQPRPTPPRGGRQT